MRKRERRMTLMSATAKIAKRAEDGDGLTLLQQQQQQQLGNTPSASPNPSPSIRGMSPDSDRDGQVDTRHVTRLRQWQPGMSLIDLKFDRPQTYAVSVGGKGRDTICS